MRTISQRYNGMELEMAEKDKDLAFLIKIGQVKDEKEIQKPATKKDEE
jgi:hypothetical protein